MAVPQIDPLPQPPNRQNPTNFPTLADAFLAALAATFPTQANDVADFVNDKAASASASAASAINAPGTSATSMTQNAIGTGSKTFAIQTGKAFVVGQFVTAAQTSAPGNWMGGQITAHDPTAGSLTIAVLALSGSGTVGDWTIGLSTPMQFVGATAAEIWGGSNSTHPVTAASLTAAGAFQVLADGTTITPDLGAGLNFAVTLGGNRTLANPANAQSGDSGLIVLTQDGTGSRALAYGSAWKFPGGAPVLSTAAGAIDAFSFAVVSPTLILCSTVRGFR